MPIQIVRVDNAHVPELGRICFEAFGSLHDHHRVPRDFHDAELAHMVVEMLSNRDDFVGFAAIQNGKPVGSNFISLTDPVSGVGPITVDPTSQARGVGRALMQAVIDEARGRGVHNVRLMQEAVNTTSLSLYTSLGFDWRDGIAIVQLAAAAARNPAVRPLEERDLPQVDRLSTQHYHHTRVNEVSHALRSGFPAVAIEHGSNLSGYLIPGYFGHGFADSQEDMLALLGEIPHVAPEMFHKVLVPMSQPGLYRSLLAGGARTVKVMNYMTLGQYNPPTAAWIPSIGN